MKKVLIGLVVVGVVAGVAVFLQSASTAQVASNDDSSFENDAAAILSTNLTSQAKLDQLAANLKARIAAKQLRAAKSGVVYKAPVFSTPTTAPAPARSVAAPAK